VDNAGAPSGIVSDITWQSWGDEVALGSGRGFIYKPGGGYYPGSVKTELRASDLGRCAPNGPRAYRKLEARNPDKPGGPLGAWFLWSGTGDICTYL
jgi:hypothetical protein